MKIKILTAVLLVRDAHTQSYERSPFDSTLNSHLGACNFRNTMDAENAATLTNISVTQDAAEGVILGMPHNAVWSPVWLSDSSGTVLAMVETTASSSSVAISWTNLSWTSEPEELRAWGLSGCTLARSTGVVRTWRGTLQRWMAAVGQYNHPDAPAELQTPQGTVPYRPVVTVDWPSRTFSMGGLLTTNASGTSLASYYYVQDGAMRIFDFWNVDGASAGFALTASVVEAGSGSGDFSGGLVFSSDNIAIPPGAQSIQACAAVVYDTECFDVSLLGYLVAEIESSLTALVLDNATQTLLEVSSPLTSLASTSVRVRPSPACLAAGDSTVTYAKDAAGSVLAFKIGGELSFSTTAAVVDVYLRCNGVLSTLSVDVTALRVPEPVRTCTVGDTTYQPGALMYVNSSTGSNCTCNYGQVYCAEGSGGVGVEGTAQETNVSVPLPILLALIGGLVLLCACIALSVWRTNRLREEQDRLSTEEGKVRNREQEPGSIWRTPPCPPAARPRTPLLRLQRLPTCYFDTRRTWCALRVLCAGGRRWI